MGGFPVVLLLCGLHGNAAKQDTQIMSFHLRLSRRVIVFNAEKHSPHVVSVPQRSQL